MANNNTASKKAEECSSSSEILLCNANGINSKFQNLLIQYLHSLHQEGKAPLAICITETKLKEGGPGPPNLSCFNYSSPHSYIRSFSSSDKKQVAAGGVSVYVHQSVGCHRRPDLESKDLEIVWLELHNPHLYLYPEDSLLLGVIYRSPRDFPDGKTQKKQ
jgi:hypothetical protein